LRPPADLSAPPADADKRESGLVSRVLAPGEGEARPSMHDRVQLVYTAWTRGGQVQASTHTRGAPAAVYVRDLPPGWAEGVMLMRVGERRRLWVPESLAYRRGSADHPAGGLVIDMELRKLSAGRAPTPPPPDLERPPADVAATDSGLRHRLLSGASGGAHAAPHDWVRVAYTGWSSDGRMIETTDVRGGSALLPADRGFPGFQEALSILTAGEKRRFWIPEKLAFQHYPGVHRGDVVYDIELLDVVDMPEPPAAPPDVGRVPEGAKRTPSGLAYRVLREGVGKRKPGPKDRVAIHFSYWRTDGTLVDSSIPSGEPARARIGRMAPGLAEGVQDMVVGEKRRLWIPESLGPKGTGGKRQGMLVYDIDLLGIYVKKRLVDSIDPEVLGLPSRQAPGTRPAHPGMPPPPPASDPQPGNQ
jgi:peptidylprolyl isomerase